MGEKQNGLFQLSFNPSLKVEFQGSRVTSDGGLILVRELNERLGFGNLIAQHLTDSRCGKKTQLPLADPAERDDSPFTGGWPATRMSIPQGWTERLSQRPTFRLVGSERIWERGAALTSRLQSLETDLLTQAAGVTCILSES
jgi:hypothetical protein